MLLVRNASSSTVYWGVTSSTSPEIATLVLPKMIVFTDIRTNVVAQNASSSTNPKYATLVLILPNTSRTNVLLH
jgi:hypothetical protein